MANGIWTIDAACLRDMLLLPKGVRIEDMMALPLDRANGRLSIKLSCDIIPEVVEGAALPRVSVEYTDINGPVEYAGIHIIN